MLWVLLPKNLNAPRRNSVWHVGQAAEVNAHIKHKVQKSKTQMYAKVARILMHCTSTAVEWVVKTLPIVNAFAWQGFCRNSSQIRDSKRTETAQNLMPRGWLCP